MKRSGKFLRSLVLACVVSFQAVQAFHTHKAKVSDDHCAICQIVHQTPSTAASTGSFQLAGFICHSLFVDRDVPLVVIQSAVNLSTRAPPAA